jgi:ribosomal protein L40E
MKLIDDKKTKDKKETDNEDPMLPERNFYSYEDYKERFLPISNNEYKGRIDKLDIVSAIFYYVNKYKDFIFYKIPLDAFANAFHEEEDYDKLYDAIVKLTVKENKRYFNRISKLAHEALLKYFEDNKEYTEKDIRRDKIRMKRELREGVLICPKCGTKNPVVNIFCSKCGHKLKKSESDSKKEKDKKTE